jgi:CDP-4-dehydro-6-deoxyglucose reductase
MISITVVPVGSNGFRDSMALQLPAACHLYVWQCMACDTVGASVAPADTHCLASRVRYIVGHSRKRRIEPMPGLITLSRAARLVGVKRGTLQQQIQRGELRTFEGELLLADLLHVYPQTEVEDTTMLERVGSIKELAVNKIIRADEGKPDVDTLAARIYSLGQELARERQSARRSNRIIDELEHRLNETAPGADQRTQAEAFRTLRDWFFRSIEAVEPADNSTGFIAREAFLRVMAAQVRILPSGHEFFIEGSDSILEAGLRGGLALNYGCSNGNCGLCKCKVLSGEVKKIATHDYVFSETEKALGYILACANTAITDVVLEGVEANSSSDIPLQEIEVKVRKIDKVNDRLLILHARTPRTKRLRFLAGQYLTMQTDNGITQDCSIASCPCDDMNLEFHIPVVSGDPFSDQVAALRPPGSLNIIGPRGDFTLDDDSPRSLVFIAVNTGFGPVKSLIEHAMALDIAEQLRLYWITTPGNRHYLGNLCRSWDDALDNFHYRPLAATGNITVESLLDMVIGELDDITNLDFYACMPAPLLETLQAKLLKQCVLPGQIRLEQLHENPVT